jgi:hypothetical protein
VKAALAMAVLVLAVAGCGSSSPVAVADPAASPTTTTVRVTAAQRRAQQHRAAVKRRLAAKRAAARAAAKRRAVVAAYARANAWHKGYLGPVGDNFDVYFRWRTDRRCADYAVHGCLHIEVIAASGCDYLQVSVNEIQGGAIVGGILANQLNVPPETPAILELDADRDGIRGSPPTITCT